MSSLMYQCSVPVFVHNLKNLSAILKLAAADAKTRSIDPTVMLNARLAPDMLPLVRQVQISTDHAKGCCARLAGVEAPVLEDTETSFAELESRIKAVLRFIRSLKPAQFAGSESREVVMRMPFGNLSFDGIDYLNSWALPNFYFHYTTAYSLLRHNGVGIGKREFLGQMSGVRMDAKAAKVMGVKATARTGKKSVSGASAKAKAKAKASK